MVQMGRFAGRRPAQLSGGQQQRIALARALVFEPELVLMDEPLGALDKQLREHMQYEIKHLHEQLGVTVVYVTHDQSEALTMSDRVAVFNDGVVQQLASPADLYERPENAFVAQFIGENNKLRGMVESVEGGVRHGAARRRRHLPGAARSAAARPAPAPSSRSGPSGWWSAATSAADNRTEAQVARAHLPWRPHPLPARGARQRRLHRQGAEQPGQPDAAGRGRHDGGLEDRGLPGARRRMTANRQQSTFSQGDPE